MVTAPEPLWKIAAEQFRAKLRTDEFPEHATIHGLKEVMRVTGIGRTSAQKVLEYLVDQNELAVTQGSGTLVLSAPPTTPEEHREAEVAALRELQAAGETFEHARRGVVAAVEKVARLRAVPAPVAIPESGLSREDVEQRLEEIQAEQT